MLDSLALKVLVVLLVLQVLGVDLLGMLEGWLLEQAAGDLIPW